MRFVVISLFALVALVCASDEPAPVGGTFLTPEELDVSTSGVATARNKVDDASIVSPNFLGVENYHENDRDLEESEEASDSQYDSNEENSEETDEGEEEEEEEEEEGEEESSGESGSEDEENDDDIDVNEEGESESEESGSEVFFLNADSEDKGPSLLPVPEEEINVENEQFLMVIGNDDDYPDIDPDVQLEWPVFLLCIGAVAIFLIFIGTWYCCSSHPHQLLFKIKRRRLRKTTLKFPQAQPFFDGSTSAGASGSVSDVCTNGPSFSSYGGGLGGGFGSGFDSVLAPRAGKNGDNREACAGGECTPGYAYVNGLSGVNAPSVGDNTYLYAYPSNANGMNLSGMNMSGMNTSGVNTSDASGPTAIIIGQ